MKKKKISTYDISTNIIMTVWTILIILPFLLLFMSSITDENTLIANGYSFFPKKLFTLRSPCNPTVKYFTLV